MRGAKFSSGKYAWGLCDRCGFRYKLLDLRGEFIRGRASNNLVCISCWDYDHPQNFLDRAVTVDPQALQFARPQIDLENSRRLLPFNMWVGKWAKQPDLVVQQELVTAQQIKASNERIATDWELRRFRWANQRNQP